MLKFLQKEERIDLKALHKKTRDGKMRDRIKAVLAYDAGHSYSEIARWLLLDDETIRRYIKEYREAAKLTSVNRGSHSHLTDPQTEQLIAHLRDTIYQDVKGICVYVCQQFGVWYSRSGMTQWLHSHGFCYKKPQGRPAKADSEKQEAFIAYYDQLKANKGEKEAIYFVDAVHPQHQTQLSYGWLFKGVRTSVPTTARQKRLNFIGGFCCDTQRFVYTETELINANSICAFLRQLRRKETGNTRIHVVWDNASYHHSKPVKWLAEKLNIQLHYLPPYSPNLNPIERLWKIYHEQVRYNRYYKTFKAFKQATCDFFKTIARKKRLLRRRINDNFHRLDNVNFAS